MIQATDISLYFFLNCGAQLRNINYDKRRSQPLQIWTEIRRE